MKPIIEIDIENDSLNALLMSCALGDPGTGKSRRKGFALGLSGCSDEKDSNNFDMISSAANITAFNKAFDDEYWKCRRKGLTFNSGSFDFEAVSYKEARISWRKEAAKKRRIPIRKLVRKPWTLHRGSIFWIKYTNGWIHPF